MDKPLLGRCSQSSSSTLRFRRTLRACRSTECSSGASTGKKGMNRLASLHRASTKNRQADDTIGTTAEPYVSIDQGCFAVMGLQVRWEFPWIRNALFEQSQLFLFPLRCRRAWRIPLPYKCSLEY